MWDPMTTTESDSIGYMSEMHLCTRSHVLDLQGALSEVKAEGGRRGAKNRPKNAPPQSELSQQLQKVTAHGLLQKQPCKRN